jgi:hypothetical protein
MTPINKDTIVELQELLNKLKIEVFQTNVTMQILEKEWGLSFECEFTSHEIRNSKTVTHKVILKPSIDIVLNDL